MKVHPNRRSLDLTGILVALLILAVGVILILFGHQLEGTPGELTREAGVVLIGTVLVTYVYEFVLRRQHDRYVLRLVADSVVINGPQYGLT